MLHVQVNGKLYTKKLKESLIHCLASIKTQTINNQHTDATPGNRACYVDTLNLVERALSHFLLDPGPMNVTISRLKKWFRYLDLPVTQISDQKHWLHVQ